MGTALGTAFLFLLVSAAGLPAAPSLEGPPTGLTNARLEVRVLAGSLQDAIRGLGAGPSWIGYAVPALREGHTCCYDAIHEDRSWPRGCCRLEGRKGGVSIRSDGDRPSSGPEAHPGAAKAEPTVVVLLRVEKGRVGRVGAYSPDCGLDAGGLPVLWLTGVPPAESLRVLEPLVGTAAADEALAAIAAHADPAADAALERLVAPGMTREVREQVAFWLGESRGQRGYEVLTRLLREDEDPELREHVVFALSESDVPAATDAIIEAARRDPVAEVRGQALFWLAQKAGRQAAAAITRAIEEDPETEVKKKAVFALSEMEDGEGVPLLIRLARENRNPAVREQAFFWLGQSEDPRALEFLTEVLKR